ncbi:transglutaminase family protein [Gloeocapsa sp. PCC 73106]|uniref:transglutaminase family protein n=1 Tax=Gloeocapsa sp. PCC 73106 TaxID=102232 RepID=UPI0002ABBAFF|nr:transglutaminase family protein [Gloeocapsa sp. PCC 73106]ELR97950.1 transglutaminase-like enzyme, predicted cysteine protease [Gloeocapsa sp. PCC 73106]
MRYQIEHTTTYNYNQPVLLKPHVVRLQPRSDAWQKLGNFKIEVDPQPEGISHFTDLDGNYLIKLWFTKSTENLVIHLESEVETKKSNPFDYLSDAWALQLPLDYPTSLKNQIAPYLHFYQGVTDPVALKLAQEILQEVDGRVSDFLSKLNQLIYQHSRYIHRERGEPQPPGITWSKQQGSCRDLSVLFMEVCRSVGLGARFVSGYQEGDIQQDSRDLHAWTEVYVPGGGWRGYDPTHGLLVSDRHIALAASSIPSYAAPVDGSFSPVEPFWLTQLTPQSQLDAQIKLTHF